MTSPAPDVVTALVLFGLFFSAAAIVLGRYNLALQIARDEREAELLEQLAQPCEWMSQVEAPSQSTLQAQESRVGVVAEAAFAAHAFESVAAGKPTLRGTDAKGAQTL